MVVSVRVGELFSVKACDLGNWVRGRSRSLKMSRFEWPCDFLLVGHCNYSCILYYFRVFWRRIISWPWNRGYRSFKVIEIGAIQKLGCGFLFAFYSRPNYGWRYLVSFGRYSDLLVENREIFTAGLEKLQTDLQHFYFPTLVSPALSTCVCVWYTDLWPLLARQYHWSVSEAVKMRRWRLTIRYDTIVCI